jgi:predicted MFS family arabinose efflux permease
MWLTLLPACAFGLLDVLAPLRLDHLGASGLAIGATFFTAAGVEAIVSPLVGRFTDRRGAVPVVRGALAAAGVSIVILQLPSSAPALAVAVVLAAGVLGVLWVPALQLLTGGADRIGLEHGFAFAFFNLAWAAASRSGPGPAARWRTPPPTPCPTCSSRRSTPSAPCAPRWPCGLGGVGRPRYR